MSVNRLSRIALLPIVVTLLVATLAACGDDKEDESSASSSASPAAKPCPGPSLAVGVITSLSGPAPFPELFDGARAAVRAVNDSCAAGVPLDLVTCDDHANPNDGAACGRTMVDKHAIALVGSGSAVSDSYETIIQDAGIPSVGNLGIGQVDLTRPTSFPFSSTLARLRGLASLAHAAHARTVSIVAPDVPAVQASIELVKASVASFGMTFDRAVLVPADATDLAQYASQAADSDAILIALGIPQTEALLHSFLDSGITPQSKTIVAPTLNQQVIDRFSGALDGVYMSAQFAPLSSQDNSGIAQFLDETRAVGIQSIDVNALTSWRAVHVVADILAQVGTRDAAHLTAFLSTYKFEAPETAPVDFSAPAFADDPLLSKLRIFSRQFSIWKIEDGKIVEAVKGFVEPQSDYRLGA